MTKHSDVLGGMTPTAFMREHWHKRLRVIRQAIAGFTDLLSPTEMMKLATLEHVESRLVIRTGKTWTLEQGPFKPSRWKSLPDKHWTLLVQGLNLHVPAADQLLRKFNFVPHVRLDDVMVSLAAPGGGVGPHFDSYDVFLLQGMGTRRWGLSTQTDLELDPNAPLKILKRMKPTESHDLVAGDMLYLPPQVAHDGAAVQTEGFCTTYSIGFRAPTRQEIVDAFAHWAVDTTEVEGRLADPELAATSTPGKIPVSYAKTIAEAIAELRIDKDAIAQFAGCFATEPKASVGFVAPVDPLSRAAFAKLAFKSGVQIDPGALCVYDAKHLFINGEAFELMGDVAFWHTLADQRATAVPQTLAKETIDALYDWYDE
ncbi:MAG: JmjC domain-containing protein, partial [Casimicrobium sp.]